MKNYIKKLVFFLSVMLMISCSDDDSSSFETFNITEYIIGGKLVNNRVCIMIFSSNGLVRIINVDEEMQLSYTIDGNSVILEDYGSFEVENDEIIFDDLNDINFENAVLLKKPEENQLKGKTFSGMLSNIGFQFEHFVRFSNNGNLYGANETFETATPNDNYDLIGNVSGKFQDDQFSDVFYFNNNQLVYERKVSFQGLQPIYFSSQGLDIQ
ncbi:hypothetical protein M0M57_08720 [Flavobacterium azooxidireducens]|uniref:Uncharacterized protein n=1 Tax=Flavobacterium azooxidireducens TaxID=1871076 RepID=A0ABY4KAA2_9FLAO|nr:hypothetical protein [Flavobacterium azooxidireducens]UPQ77716.1 hypothetical protein M0M57_08720 [Flavobacterium azooxidireducens]